MKKLYLVLATAIGLTIMPAMWAGAVNTLYSGTVSGPGDGLYGTYGFSDAEFSWTVTQDGGRYLYEYTFTDDQNFQLSHLILQVSPEFTAANISDPNYEIAADDPKYYSADPLSNPGMPEILWGIKFDTWGSGSEIKEITISFESDKEPVWGNFYAMDGLYGEDRVPVYAWSGTVSGFGNNVAVPDTVGKTPEPLSLILLGSGLAGAGLFRRRRAGK